MENHSLPEKENRKLYDQAQLLRLNNQAFAIGLIDENARNNIERQIWAGL